MILPRKSKKFDFPQPGTRREAEVIVEVGAFEQRDEIDTVRSYICGRATGLEFRSESRLLVIALREPPHNQRPVASRIAGRVGMAGAHAVTRDYVGPVARINLGRTL